MCLRVSIFLPNDGRNGARASSASISRTPDRVLRFTAFFVEFYARRENLIPDRANQASRSSNADSRKESECVSHRRHRHLRWRSRFASASRQSLGRNPQVRRHRHQSRPFPVRFSRRPKFPRMQCEPEGRNDAILAVHLAERRQRRVLRRSRHRLPHQLNELLDALRLK